MVSLNDFPAEDHDLITDYIRDTIETARSTGNPIRSLDAWRIGIWRRLAAEATAGRWEEQRQAMQDELARHARAAAHRHAGQASPLHARAAGRPPAGGTAGVDDVPWPATRRSADPLADLADSLRHALEQAGLSEVADTVVEVLYGGMDHLVARSALQAALSRGEVYDAPRWMIEALKERRGQH